MTRPLNGVQQRKLLADEVIEAHHTPATSLYIVENGTLRTYLEVSLPVSVPVPVPVSVPVPVPVPVPVSVPIYTARWR